MSVAFVATLPFSCSPAADIFTTGQFDPTYIARANTSDKETDVSNSKSVAREKETNGWLQTRPGERCLIRVTAPETGKMYSVVEITSEPGDATPLHVHANEDEYFVVLEGVAKIACGDRIFDAKAGEAVFLPRKVPHAWGNRSITQLRFVAIVTPGGVEEVMRIIAAGNVADLAALAETVGVSVLGPAPF
jgi:mannose-6-phosphate isomerase-like protein (cupin superfamily)